MMLAACNNTKAPAEKATGETAAEVEWAIVKLEVEGMTCDGCENAIKAGVEGLEGIASVESSHEEGWTEVKYDPATTNPEAIGAKIEETGYSVKGEL